MSQPTPQTYNQYLGADGTRHYTLAGYEDGDITLIQQEDDSPGLENGIVMEREQIEYLLGTLLDWGYTPRRP